MVNPNKAPRPSTSKKPGPLSRKTLTVERAIAKALKTGSGTMQVSRTGIQERCPVITGKGVRCTRWPHEFVNYDGSYVHHSGACQIHSGAEHGFPRSYTPPPGKPASYKTLQPDDPRFPGNK